jgi:hypothetical protein
MPNGPVEAEANSTIVIRIKINRDIYRTTGFVTVSIRVHMIVDFPSTTDLFVNFGSRCREVADERGKCRFYMLLYPCESLFVLLSLSLYFVLDALDPSHSAVQIIGRQGPSRQDPEFAVVDHDVTDRVIRCFRDHVGLFVPLKHPHVPHPDCSIGISPGEVVAIIGSLLETRLANGFPLDQVNVETEALDRFLFPHVEYVDLISSLLCFDGDRAGS